MLQKIEKREREKLIPHVDKLDSPLMDIWLRIWVGTSIYFSVYIVA